MYRSFLSISVRQLDVYPTSACLAYILSYLFRESRSSLRGKMKPAARRHRKENWKKKQLLVS